MNLLFQAVIVLGAGFITINLVGFSLRFLFPTLYQPETFSLGIIIPASVISIVVMISLTIYFSKKNTPG
ncbi:MAG: hypothetical protein A2Z42_01720 [Candidatus Woykebacteria bacterium RBG_19FT_COMBO_43_10]|uniref:Uncharacterized protein n=1 Tax=Candidatus Woykebacteria bacterium RBG_19FT_COMBO_43_10 TaxID=1802598 RepID=A0A1G1WII0_9BACT|nr:MAG: hypothetical protein A2Z42_01720 [Candidatus Woykebacteria bacterium RBG_19FT_COMBO_43_10]